MLAEGTGALGLTLTAHVPPIEYLWIILLNDNGSDCTMKLPRLRPKIMGVPVSIETVKGLTKASKDIFMRKFVPDDVKQIRMDICRVCPSWEHASNRCNECGCQMRVKTSLTSSECPLKKWGRHVSSEKARGEAGINSAETQESAK